jgi:hypothetical protein
MQFHTFEGNVDHLKAFLDEYSLQKLYAPPLSGKNRSRRKPRQDMVCRFCGLRNGETTFKSKPHIISRLFGNNSGISDYECDRCNNHFSTFETSTADFLGVNRSIFALGKESIPTYKAPDGTIEVRGGNQFGQEIVEISAMVPGIISSLEDTGQIEMTFTSNSYIPLNVYKCLFKIALTIMPADECQHYKTAIDFLLTGNYTEWFSHWATQVMRCESGSEPPVPYAMLFKKKDVSSIFPTHVFKLYFQNICLQIHLPSYDLDKILEKEESFTMPLCPPLIFIDTWPTGRAHYSKIDLSSSEKRIGEMQKLYLNFDKDEMVDSLHKYNPDQKWPPQTINPSENISIIFARDKFTSTK